MFSTSLFYYYHTAKEATKSINYQTKRLHCQAVAHNELYIVQNLHLYRAVIEATPEYFSLKF